MRRHRIIPLLLYDNKGLVKSVKFKNHQYVGDYLNAIKIFNEKEVDELIFLDINASKNKKQPDIDLIKEIASECFMPLCYGGGIESIEQMKQIFSAGVEKVAINTSAYRNPELIREASRLFGNQSIVVSIDIKKDKNENYFVYTENGTYNTSINPIEYAKKVEQLGAGELLINSIDNDGTYNGYDTDLISNISESVSIPVIACGGANSIKDLGNGLKAGASAVAAGSLFVYYGRLKAVLINFPSQVELNPIFKIKSIGNKEDSNFKVLHITTWYPHKKQKIEASFIKEHIDSLNNYCQNHVINLDFVDSKNSILKFEYFKESNYEKIYICNTKIKNSFSREIIASIWFIYILIKHNCYKYNTINIHIAYPIATYLNIIKNFINKPVVITEHWSAYHFNFYVDKNLKGLNKIKRIFFSCDKLFAVSKSLADDIINFSGNKKLDYEIIPNIVDTNTFHIERAMLPNAPVFLMVSIWSTIKKPLIIIDVFKKIISNYPNAILKIGGYGEQMKDIESKIKELNLEKSVLLLGRLSKEEVAKEINNSTALIHSSSYETFSVICAEAISCGIPVIASNVGGIPSFINERNGILISNENEQNWEEGIKQLITNRHLYDDIEISKNAHALFSSENVGKRYYNELKNISRK